MEIALIVAVADNGVIGNAGRMPWHLPAELRRFRERTMGHHVVMGRLTWVSIGRPLAGRVNIVVSRDRSLAAAGCTVVDSLDAAISLAVAAGEPELFIIGGARLYREALPRADRIYLTRVHVSPPGDVFFAALDPAEWIETGRESAPGPGTLVEAEQPAFDIVVMERRGR